MEFLFTSLAMYFYVDVSFTTLDVFFGSLLCLKLTIQFVLPQKLEHCFEHQLDFVALCHRDCIQYKSFIDIFSKSTCLVSFHMKIDRFYSVIVSALD